MGMIFLSWKYTFLQRSGQNSLYKIEVSKIISDLHIN